MDEFITVSLKKMSAGSIYKILLIGLTCSLVPLGLLNGILAAVGVNLLTLRWNPPSKSIHLHTSALMCNHIHLTSFISLNFLIPF